MFCNCVSVHGAETSICKDSKLNTPLLHGNRVTAQMVVIGNQVKALDACGPQEDIISMSLVLPS